MDLPTAIAVLSQEKTASTAVYRALFVTCPASDVHHAHNWRANPEKPERAAKNLAALSAITDLRRARSVVSIRRDPVERCLSGLWHVEAELIARMISDPPALARKLSRRLHHMLDWNAIWESEVLRPLGLRLPRGDGRLIEYTSSTGIRAFVLDFADLGRQFAELSERLTGSAHILPRDNTAAEYGDLALYGKFCRKFRPWVEKHAAQRTSHSSKPLAVSRVLIQR